MSQNQGEDRNRAPGEITRKEFLAGAVAGLVTAGVWAVAGRGSQSTTGNTQQSRLANDMLATAAAGEGKPIVGNVGNFHERIVRRVQGATNMIVVVYRNSDVVSAGTAWRAQLDSGSAVDLVSAGHVVTQHGKHEIGQIQELWVGHPFSANGFTRFAADEIHVVLPQGNMQGNYARDAAVIRIPVGRAPDWLHNAPALEFATIDNVHQGEQLLVAGIPLMYMPEVSDAGLQVTPLYANAMPMVGPAIAPGCFNLRGEVIDGVSGASVVDDRGQVCGLVVAQTPNDRYTTVAAPVDILRELAVTP